MKTSVECALVWSRGNEVAVAVATGRLPRLTLEVQAPEPPSLYLEEIEVSLRRVAPGSRFLAHAGNADGVHVLRLTDEGTEVANASDTVTWIPEEQLDGGEQLLLEVSRRHAEETPIPWHRPGWWVEDVLPWLAEDVEVVPMRASDRSFVARLQSKSGERGLRYFKADREPSPSDARVTKTLADLGVRSVPEPLRIDGGRGWMLMKPLPGEPLQPSSPVPEWEAAARTLASLQRRTESELPRFLAEGARDYRDDRLGERLIEMLGDGAALGLREPGGLPENEVAFLPSLIERTREWCSLLEGSSIPPALVHQDFVSCNIRIVTEPSSTSGTPDVVIFDWSDCVVGHPFFSFDRLLDECWSDETRKPAAISAYLEAWTDLMEPTELREEFGRCQRLRVLYEGLRWYDEIAHLPPSAPNTRNLRADLRVGVSGMLRWVEAREKPNG